MNGSLRSSNVNKQIGLSFVFKIAAIACNFLLVPITLKYLGQEQYGVWMTVLSILSWISFFDLGLGNGMRNKVSEALAKNEMVILREYISSTYIAIGCIVLVAYCFLLIFSSGINWQRVLNVYAMDNRQLQEIMLLSAFVLFFNFLLSLINQVINAYQMSSLITVNQLLANGLALMLTYILILTIPSSLFMVAFCYGFSVIMANFLISWKFYNRHSEAKPAFRFFCWHKVRSITGLSIKFFIIQLAALVFFAKDNIIIAQILGPSHVTTYSITFKLFSIITFAHGIILGPLWSAFTDAYVKEDFLWIKHTVKKMNLLMLLIGISVFCLCLASPVILHYWLGSSYEELEGLLIWLMGLFVIISAWNNTYAIFLNGIGKLKLSFYLTPIITILNIPLSIYMTDLHGLNGMVVATILCMVPAAILQPIQYGVIVRKIKINNRNLNKLFCS